MPTLTYIHRRKLISSLAIALVLLGGSFGVAKSAAAASPARPATVAALVHEAPAPRERLVHAEPSTIRERFAELEVDSGEVRNPLETLNLASARPDRPSAVGGGRPHHQPPQP